LKQELFSEKQETQQIWWH